MSRIRTFIKKVELAIASGDADGAREALKVAQPEIQRGVSRGVLHRNTASRKDFAPCRPGQGHRRLTHRPAVPLDQQARCGWRRIVAGESPIRPRTGLFSCAGTDVGGRARMSIAAG